ncbi:hypothetical protein niasHS_008020 [Heterodera schachtii]|uniref:Uncharacterized protein n=1 Tax=Heterodera schachtii TaxID=97005 RepID=A0ABD2J5Y3_HETSC
MTKQLIYMIAYITGRSVGSLFNDEFYLGVNYTPRFGATFNTMSLSNVLVVLAPWSGRFHFDIIGGHGRSGMENQAT